MLATKQTCQQQQERGWREPCITLSSEPRLQDLLSIYCATIMKEMFTLPHKTLRRATIWEYWVITKWRAFCGCVIYCGKPLWGRSPSSLNHWDAPGGTRVIDLSTVTKVLFPPLQSREVKGEQRSYGEASTAETNAFPSVLGTRCNCTSTSPPTGGSRVRPWHPESKVLAWGSGSTQRHRTASLRAARTCFLGVRWHWEEHWRLHIQVCPLRRAMMSPPRHRCRSLSKRHRRPDTSSVTLCSVSPFEKELTPGAGWRTTPDDPVAGGLRLRQLPVRGKSSRHTPCRPSPSSKTGQQRTQACRLSKQGLIK